MPVPHPAARLVGITVAAVVALLATFAPRVRYPTEVGKGTRLVVQTSKTVTGGREIVASCVAVER